MKPMVVLCVFLGAPFITATQSADRADAGSSTVQTDFQVKSFYAPTVFLKDMRFERYSDELKKRLPEFYARLDPQKNVDWQDLRLRIKVKLATGEYAYEAQRNRTEGRPVTEISR